MKQNLNQLQNYIKEIEHFHGELIFFNFNDRENRTLFLDVKAFKTFLFYSVPMNMPYVLIDKSDGEIIFRLEREIFNFKKNTDGKYSLTFYQDREKDEQYQEYVSPEDVLADVKKMIKAG